MTTLREAAQRAMKSLEDAIKVWTEEMEFRSCVDASDEWLESYAALREALAQPEPEPLCTAAMFDDAFLAKSGLSPNIKLYTAPPQHPTEVEDEYGSEADTEELLRIGAMPEPLRLAAQLEKTMQWPLHGIAADCLRRMHNEANSCLLTAAPDLLAALIKTAALLHPDLPEHKAARAAIAKALGEKG